MQTVHENIESDSPAILGIVALAFAVLGISQLPLEVRILGLSVGFVCFPLSFHLQLEWPRWVRWTLALAADYLLAYVAVSAVRGL